MSAVAEAEWHDLECGRYTADLALWRELAAAAGGPILDVGAGTGRVALLLAAEGHEVVALDHDPGLLAVLRERGGERVATEAADARAFALGRAFALVLVPMQTVQLLGGRTGRAAFLARAAEHLLAGGRLAVALADPLEGFDAEGDPLALPLPDLAERDGVLLSSQPVRVREEEGGWVIERLRQVVGADGRRTEAPDSIRLDAVSPAELEDEGRAAGLAAEERRRVEATAEHVGSSVVVMRRG